MSGAITMAVLLLFLGFSAEAAPRVVSTNLCADQWLLAMLGNADIAALSPLAGDKNISWQWQKSATIKTVRPNVEAIMAIKPDLVVFDAYGQRLLEEKLQSLGIKTYRLPEVRRLKQLAGIADEISALTGVDGTHQKTLMKSLAEKPECVECKAAILLWDGNYSTGSDNVAAELLRRSGYAIFNTSDKRLGIEEILHSAIVETATIIRADNYGDLPSMARERAEHPAMRRMKTIHVDAAKLICPGPSFIAAMEELDGKN